MKGEQRKGKYFGWERYCWRLQGQILKLVYNNDRTYKGSYSHQRPRFAETGRKQPAATQNRTNRRILPRKRTSSKQPQCGNTHPTSSRDPPHSVSQEQSTPQTMQTSEGYLWDRLSTPAKATFKEAVLNIMIDR